MKLFSLAVFFILYGIGLSAQVKDTARLRGKSDTTGSHVKSDTTGSRVKSDTARIHRRSFDLFENDDTLTRNDYLLSFGKVFQLLNKASALSQPVPAILLMAERMDEDDSALNIIKDRLSTTDR